jgi:glycosyltransferase involved in cell wall biosynthesis
VLAQSYQDFEVIILDDYSNDNSREIIEQYRNHPKVSHIVYNEINSGSTFKQWGKGIELAKSEWIWIAESDDWCEPTLLEELVNGVSFNDNIVLGYCGSIVLNGNEILYSSKSSKLKEVKEGVGFIQQEMTEINSVFNASMALFKKSSLYNISSEYLDFKFCGDWLFWIMIAQTGNVFVSGKSLNYFRKHDSDVSGKSMSNGTYYKEYPRIVFYLLNNNLIDFKRYQSLLFLRYQHLRTFNGERLLKKELLTSYVALIGKRNYLKLAVKYNLHNYRVSIWIFTPVFIKNIVRKIFCKN